MPSGPTRRERRRKQFGRPLLEPEGSNGVPLPPSDISGAVTSEHKPISSESSPAREGSIESGSPAAEDQGADISGASQAKGKKEKKSRFILFVGNLPYSATTAGIEAHFAPVKPAAVRHATDKATGRSRGFAFLEFDDVKSMESCLVGWHRSAYHEGGEEEGKDREAVRDRRGGNDEDGANPQDRGVQGKSKYAREGWRRINVQLTAGGGGKSETRRKRLREKNDKLEKERKKRAVKKNETRKGKDGEKGKDKTAKPAELETTGGVALEPNVHPSRRARFG